MISIFYDIFSKCASSQLLSRMHFSDIEIEVLFCRYDRDGDGVKIEATEAEHILDDLDDGDIQDPTNIVSARQ